MAGRPRRKVMGETAPDHAWLALVREEALEPELEIVDPHHHLWVRPGQTYLLPEFADDLADGHNVAATVYAECRSMYRQDGPEELRSLGETEFAAGCAAMADSGTFGRAKACQAMFGRVELMLGDAVRGIFERHIERSGGRFKGVRYSTAWDADGRIPNVVPDRHRLSEPSVRRAVAVMAEMGLSLDVWVYHPQLDDVVALAAANPGLTIILDHTGAPILGGAYRDRPEEVFRDWRRGIERVAVHGNVLIKLGALPIRRPGDGMDRSLPPTSDEVARAWKPWTDVCIEAFGPARSMFESNFPVQKLWSSYQVTWNAFKRIAAGGSEDERYQLFAGAARRAYRFG